MTRLQRFWRLVRVDPEGCWLWIGATAGKHVAYGQFWDGRRKVRASRWSYETFVGPVAEGWQMRHRCGVKRCVRPDHLEPLP